MGTAPSLLADRPAMELDEILRRPERWARVISWATLAGLEFGLIGPFGSYASNVFTRIAFWTGLFWFGSLLLWPSVVAALRLGPRKGLPPVFAVVAVVFLVSIPLAALSAAGTYLLWPVRASGMKTLEWYGLTIIVALPAIAGLIWLELGRAGIAPLARALPRSGAGPQDAAEAGPASGAAAEGAALPDHVLAAALCLQMEDHHVRVHMPGRSHLHFAVMRDVVAALEEGRGMRVHRSWWVARDAVRGWHRDGRSVALVLVNGLRVPVARNRLAILRARGWLDGEELPA